MKDNMLEVGDEIIVQTNRYDVARIRNVFRVTKTLAYVGDYTVRREVEHNGYLREFGGNKDSWSRTSFRFGTPERLAQIRTIAELADAQQEARELLRQVGNQLEKAPLLALKTLSEALKTFAGGVSTIQERSQSRG